jgi:hypothetical protein
MPITFSDILSNIIYFLGPTLYIVISLWCGIVVIGFILRFVRHSRYLDDLPVSSHNCSQRASLRVSDLSVPARDHSGARLCPWCAGYPGHQLICKHCGAPNVRRYPHLQ